MFCALAALWLGPLGCLLHSPTKAIIAALAAHAQIGITKAVKGVKRVGAAVRACPAWVGGRWRRPLGVALSLRGAGNVGGVGEGEGGDEEAGLLRRPLLEGGVEDGEGGDGDDDALSLSSSSSESVSAAEEEEQQEEQEEEAGNEVGPEEGEEIDGETAPTTTTPEQTPPRRRPQAQQPQPQQQSPQRPPPCLANCPGIVKGGLGPEAGRFRPLDAFRGLALALWIFVENGGAGACRFCVCSVCGMDGDILDSTTIDTNYTN